jgi:hypothetical protein
MNQDDLAGAVSVILDNEQPECLERGAHLVVSYTCPEGVAYRVRVTNKDGGFSLWAHRIHGSVDAAPCFSASASCEQPASADVGGLDACPC